MKKGDLDLFTVGESLDKKFHGLLVVHRKIVGEQDPERAHTHLPPRRMAGLPSVVRNGLPLPSYGVIALLVVPEVQVRPASKITSPSVIILKTDQR